MNLTLYLPPSAATSKSAPLLIYLSGLTCSPDNVTEKGFLHSHASSLGLALLYPDTSPRGLDLPGEHESWDFGSAASFYIDATTKPWNKNYKMESYLTKELPDLLFGAFKELDSSRGTEDNIYKQGQLLPENFAKVAEEIGASDLQVNYREGYDHSYFFISTFAGDHVQHAAKALGLL
ncbi:uncharacterized protein Triagg1_6981 [Trichoderma aggressivum f. europaeum]|uniref:S-formylglutathione hydrolase n=1 Tax=Trichoderma aggressivum f. europaeum TaxID=173218 RepID=A0AAE1LY76_9HYPO|nr:hypothetical protein Triagg1_6981 [Trichoderma aggressivum f. europaeum]